MLRIFFNLQLVKLLRNIGSLKDELVLTIADNYVRHKIFDEYLMSMNVKSRWANRVLRSGCSTPQLH